AGRRDPGLRVPPLLPGPRQRPRGRDGTPGLPAHRRTHGNRRTARRSRGRAGRRAGARRARGGLTRVRIASARREDDFEINVISLIDVMLTLLMFFVLTTTFVQHTRMQVTLPQAESSADEAQREGLSVLIDRDGRYFIDNNEVLNPGLDSLKEAITRFAGDDRERPVTLRADAMTPHQAVVTAMDALGELGFTRLSIATTRVQAADAK